MQKYCFFSLNAIVYKKLTRYFGSMAPPAVAVWPGGNGMWQPAAWGLRVAGSGGAEAAEAPGRPWPRGAGTRPQRSFL